MDSRNAVPTVLVTGGNGFIGGRCIRHLLDNGYRVRATVRSPEREQAARRHLAAGGLQADAALSFAYADLTADDGWKPAAQGCQYVIHAAGPFPPGEPRDRGELVTPARDGTVRVLRAARDAGVQRVVMTSSFAAVGYGHAHDERVFTEADWTDIGAGTTAYVASRTLAERAAWEFHEAEGGGLELCVVNPVAVLGPVQGEATSTSLLLVKGLLDRVAPRLPDMWHSIVDVRDLAELQLRAMLHPEAAQQRFIATAGEPMSMLQIAGLLRRQYGEAARRVPTKPMPDWLLRLAARFDRRAAQIRPDLGVVRRTTSDKARRTLGWRPRPNTDVIIATADSLLRQRPA
jgi:nucleoside-diphosphate-sugar epimerase